MRDWVGNDEVPVFRYVDNGSDEFLESNLETEFLDASQTVTTSELIPEMKGRALFSNEYLQGKTELCKLSRERRTFWNQKSWAFFIFSFGVSSSLTTFPQFFNLNLSKKKSP